MTVEQLIAELQKQPKDRRVRVRDYRGVFRDVDEVRDQYENASMMTKYVMIFSD